MGEDIEGYEEYKEDQQYHSPQDVLKAEIAKNSKSSSFRDRLYSSSGVIIEGVDETKIRKADKIDEWFNYWFIVDLRNKREFYNIKN